MNHKTETIFDRGTVGLNSHIQSLKRFLQNSMSSYFADYKNIVKILNGGYELDVNSFIYSERFLYDRHVYFQPKIFFPQEKPEPDLITLTDNQGQNLRPYFDKFIYDYIELGHDFSYRGLWNSNKAISDFVKWRKIFENNNINGEIITLQFTTELNFVPALFQQYCYHNMALNEVNNNGNQIQTVIDAFNNIGKLELYCKFTYLDKLELKYTIHAFLNYFDSATKRQNIKSVIENNKISMPIMKDADFWIGQD